MHALSRKLPHTLADIVQGLPFISLATVELAIRRPGALAQFLAQTMRLRRKALGYGLPSIRPTELLGHEGVYTLQFGEARVELENVPDLFFAKIVVLLQPKRAFEIGTNVGLSARTMVIYGPPDIELYTLDLPPDATVTDEMTDRHLIEKARRELGRAFRETRWEANITQLLGDSMTFDFKPYRRSMDLVHIDGSHSYPYVVSDTRNAMSMIRLNGVIIWDDYGSMRNEYGTTRYLEELHDAGYPVFQLGEDSNRAVLRATPDVLERFDAGLKDRRLPV